MTGHRGNFPPSCRYPSVPLRHLRCPSPTYWSQYYRRTTSGPPTPPPSPPLARRVSRHENTPPQTQTGMTRAPASSRAASSASRYGSSAIRTASRGASQVAENTHSCSQTSKVEKSPFARYSLTVLSIFEKKNNLEEENRQARHYSPCNVMRGPAFAVFVAKSSYRSVLEKAEQREAGLRKTTEEARSGREEDDLLPGELADGNQRMKSKETERLPNKGLQLARDVSVAGHRHLAGGTQSPARYLAANLRTGIYGSHAAPRPNTALEFSLGPCPSAAAPTDGGLHRRYTNRETRIARQLLNSIRTAEKWTSCVERPFILGV